MVKLIGMAWASVHVHQMFTHNSAMTMGTERCAKFQTAFVGNAVTTP